MYKEGLAQDESRFKDEHHKYLKMQECKDSYKPVQVGEGSLIFDEVKVVAKLQWNSRITL